MDPHAGTVGWMRFWIGIGVRNPNGISGSTFWKANGSLFSSQSGEHAPKREPPRQSSSEAGKDPKKKQLSKIGFSDFKSFLFRH